ncbi:MAG: hypothetical protein UFA98_12720 [Ruminococcus sp.]|nr:hypothetical protein [Ruminococcus sp.]
MKKAICIAVTGVILIASVCVSAFASSQSDGRAAAAETKVNRYIIKSESGRLVVYKSGDDTPFMSTETFSGHLPKSDAERLKQGIEVEGEQSLRKSLEDYCS